MPITLKDIAREAGVSLPAVSAARNGKTNCRLSSERRREVLAIAERLGYRGNFGYRLMMGRTSTRTVAVLVSMRRLMLEEYHQKLCLMLMEAFNDDGYSTYFSVLNPTGKANLDQVRDLISRGVEHFIFLGTPCGALEIAALLESEHRSYVGFKASLPRSLRVNSAEATAELVRFVSGRCGDQFVLLLPRCDIFDNIRFQGLLRFFPEIPVKVLAERFVHVGSELVRSGDQAFADGASGVAAVLEKRPETRGFICLSDEYAVGAAAELYRRGIRVGEEAMVTGFNNDASVRNNVLPISSTEHPLPEIVEILRREALSGESFVREIKLKVILRPENIRILSTVKEDLV